MRRDPLVKHIKRLAQLSEMLNKYSNAYPSNRMHAWVDEYHDIKEQHPDAWARYCAMTGASTTSNAYDCLA